MKFYTWISNDWSRNYGGPKAKRDIYNILRQTGNIVHTGVAENSWKFRAVDADGIAVLQHPTSGLTAPGKQDAASDHFNEFIRYWEQTWLKRVVILHDLKARQSSAYSSGPAALSVDEWNRREQLLLHTATTIVVHSDAMANAVRNLVPCSVASIVSIELFDYLCPCKNLPISRNRPIRIAYCGNVAGSSIFRELSEELPRSASYVYEIYAANAGPEMEAPRDDFTVHVEKDANLLPSILKRSANFGLCWWADSVMNSGYLNIIYPHKASCYLAAGIPLIAPENSYIGRLSGDLGIGIPIKSLSCIPGALDSLSLTEQQKMQHRCAALSKKIRSGRFTTSILKSLK